MDCIQVHATLTSHREVALKLLLNAEGAFNCPTERIAWGQVSLSEALGKRARRGALADHCRGGALTEG